MDARTYPLPEPRKRPFAGVLAAAAKPRVVMMLALGFSAGLPLLLIYGTLSTWLREAGVDRGTIGLLSLVGLAFSFKFLWAPLVDAVDLPGLARPLGRRRAWMLLAQLVAAGALFGMASSDPAQSLTGLILCALVLAFAAATQDIVIDGWRINAAPDSEQGLMSAAYQLGYRFALIAAGAGALYIAELVSWRAAYASMAALMGVGLVTCLVAPRVDPPDTRGPGFAAFLRSLSEPVEDVIRRADRRLVLALMLVALFRVPDFAAGVMAGPLYIDSGYTKIEIANVTKIYGIWISIAGAIVGGLAITRFGIKRPLLVGALAAAFSNLMFSWLAASTRDLGLLTLTISVDNFAGGFAGTTLIAYMSAMAGRRYAATQYALLSSLYALPGKFLGGVSGFAVNAFGYPVFFALTAAVGLPLAILCLIVGTPPKAPEDETVPAEPAHQT